MQVAYLKYFCFWIGILTTQTSDHITSQNLESGKKNKDNTALAIISVLLTSK